MSTLKEAKVGQTVTVVKLNGEGALRRRLSYIKMAVGLRPAYRGEAVAVAHLAAVASPRARGLRLRSV